MGSVDKYDFEGLEAEKGIFGELEFRISECWLRRSRDFVSCIRCATGTAGALGLTWCPGEKGQLQT